MNKIGSKPYNESHIQNIRKMLELADKNGQPLFFEFRVDDMVFIPHTNSFSAFDEYKDFMYKGAEDIEFSVFSTNPSDKNRKSYTYYLKEPQKQDLSGLDVKLQVHEEVERFKTQLQIEQLHEKLKERDNTILQQDEWIGEIQDKLREIQANPNHFGKFDLAKFAGVMLEGIVKRNPKMIAKVPGLEGIAEAFTDSDTKQIQQQPERKVSYELNAEDENETEELTENDKFYIAYGENVSKKLTEKEQEILFDINTVFITEPKKLYTVAELLDVKIKPT